MHLTKCNFVVLIVVLIVKINAQGPNATLVTSSTSPTTLATTAGKPTSTNSSLTTTELTTVTTGPLHNNSDPTSSTSISSPTTKVTEPSTPTTHSTTKAPVTVVPTVTTSDPMTTTTGVPHHNRQFDGPSFIGGIVLATGLMAIGFVAFKFYKARTERNYHTL